eukprot:TRINITY_DN3220_c0_g1_i1.p1 TRINITY_DN3220_c0_g1~~TRINITY_DN3220_c0_g1_i1.p1  ORF type:complete len:144 (-),score=23.51 TRINITY_DN3220_c0_g1_i1:81-512(-)
MDGNPSSSSSPSQTRFASGGKETIDSLDVRTHHDSDALSASVLPQILTTENVVDFSSALSQLICTADLLKYLNIRELIPLTLLSVEISMLTRDHISKKHPLYFNDYNLRKPSRFVNTPSTVHCIQSPPQSTVATQPHFSQPRW